MLIAIFHAFSYGLYNLFINLRKKKIKICVSLVLVVLVTKITKKSFVNRKMKHIPREYDATLVTKSA